MRDLLTLNIPLKTLCVGQTFQAAPRKSRALKFPYNILAHTEYFSFKIEADYERAQAAIATDLDLDLLFVDADDPDADLVTAFTEQVHRLREDLPIVLFGRQLTPKLL